MNLENKNLDICRENLKEDAHFIQGSIDFILNEGQTLLPSCAPKGASVDWIVTDGKAYIKEHILYKSPDAAENQPLTLKAILSLKNLTKEIVFENLVLKDAYVAHLMTYFNHAEGAESGQNPQAGMRIAYSYDGLDWQPLNNGYGILNEKGGTTNWLRDPHAFRKKDGTFGIVATQGWDTPYIFMWDTNDMIHFNEHFLQASFKGPVDDQPEHDLSGKRAWAPKVMYDRLEDCYYVFWADPKDPHVDKTVNTIDRPMYYNATKDFSTLSLPKVYFNTGYPIIDATIVKDNETYYMYFKDERIGEKCIRVAKSHTLTPGSFTLTDEIASDIQDSVEGPFALKSLKDNRWYLYYDDFSKTHTYKYSTTKSLSSGDWHHLGIHQSLPIHKLSYKTRISHGGQINITSKELDRILEAWDK